MGLDLDSLFDSGHECARVQTRVRAIRDRLRDLRRRALIRDRRLIRGMRLHLRRDGSRYKRETLTQFQLCLRCNNWVPSEGLTVVYRNDPCLGAVPWRARLLAGGGVVSARDSRGSACGGASGRRADELQLGCWARCALIRVLVWA